MRHYSAYRKDKKPQINWKDIWKRNAEKTLGLLRNDYPGHYGISGLQEAVKLIKAAYQASVSLRYYSDIKFWDILTAVKQGGKWKSLAG